MTAFYKTLGTNIIYSPMSCPLPPWFIHGKEKCSEYIINYRVALQQIKAYFLVHRIRKLVEPQKFEL